MLLLVLVLVLPAQAVVVWLLRVLLLVVVFCVCWYELDPTRDGICGVGDCVGYVVGVVVFVVADVTDYVCSLEPECEDILTWRRR